MSELEPDTALLARARRGLGPGRADSERVRARIDAALGASSAPPVVPVARATIPGFWLGAALGLAGATGMGGYALGYRSGRLETTTHVLPPAVALHAPAPAAASAVVEGPPPLHPVPELPAPPARQRPRPSETVASAEAPSAAHADGESSLEVETRLLARVERALRDDNPRLALGLLGELDREVPGGQLREERHAGRVVAHCELGSETAAGLVAEFEARYPASAYRTRVRAACRTPATKDGE